MDILLYAAFFILGYFLVGFFLALVKNDNSIVDTLWGLGFVLLAVFLLVLRFEADWGAFVVTGLVALWGLRLFFFIGLRNFKKPEDYRYQNMREKWRQKRGPLWLHALVKVFLGQAIFQYIIALPIILLHAFPKETLDAAGIAGIGLGGAIWMVGFFFEALGDNQLGRFKKDPANKGKIMDKGLWRYTRHPNYFGEATMWWGLYVIVALNTTMFGLLALLSPLVITWLLRFVSGVPLLEEKMKENPAFQAYAEKTNVFFPGPPKK